MSLNGKFIVIDGVDGTGKSTQLKQLELNLIKAGYEVYPVKFPRYGEPSAYFIEKYLRGEFGSLSEMGPEKSSLFYALDRYDVAQNIEAALSQGKVVVADRYLSANLGHQGSKFEDLALFESFVKWVEALEFDILEIPEPDLNIILTLDPEVALKRMKQRTDTRNYTDDQLDIHEEDINHLTKAAAAFKNASRFSRQRFTAVECSNGQDLLTIQEVEHKIIAVLDQLVREPFQPIAKNENETIYLDKSGDNPSITPAGLEYLDSIVTNSHDDVYVFNGTMDPVTIAAAMARLSRRGDDMRVTLLDEFVGKAGKDKDLLKRVITAYGDDSVQQLTGIHFVVENASNLLTKKLEWGRLAAYLEQSTRYIYFDQKDADGKYKYYTPTTLDDKTTQHYEDIMDQIFSKYSLMVRELTDYVRNNSTVSKDEQDIAWKGATRAQACDAIRSVLPVATKSTVGIFASGQALESLIMHLLSEANQEARDTGHKLLHESRKVISTFLERADKPDRGGAAIAYRANTAKTMSKLSEELLPQYSSDHKAITLADVTHRNELELVPYMLYEKSNLSLTEIEKEVVTWSYEQKSEVFDSYMGERLNRRHKPGRALEHLHYTWDLVCDYGIFRDLQRHRIVDGLEWQQLTPRYGYDIPALVEEAGLADVFEECFDLSYELYSRLQELGMYDEAQYATLMGHKMRWKITYNARQAFHFHELRTTPHGHPGYRRLVNQMHEQIAQVHPKLTSAMKFVNQDEDPELSRLAAERYTQFKLNQSNS